MSRTARAAKEQPEEERFTTIKVREGLRRWIKLRAAQEGIPMYKIVELLLAKGEPGKPWESRV